MIFRNFKRSVGAFAGCLALVAVIWAGTATTGWGQALQPLPTPTSPTSEKDPLKILSDTARRLENEQTFEFKYKFREGEVIRWQVDHTAATETRAQADSDKTNSRAQSVVKWQVTDIDSLGNTTIMLTLEAADMWQQTDDHPSIEYNSRNPRAEIPEEYRQFAEWIGIPMATYQINSNGQVIDRQEVYRNVKFGVGDFTMPLPGRPVRIGQAWRVPSNIMVRHNDGTQRKIVTQIEYRLQSVDNGVATISYDTQVLTPVDDPRIESQLMQQMSKGVNLFDLNRGQMVGMNLGWNRRCLGFKGPDSSVTYVAQYTMRQLQSSQSGEEVQTKNINKDHLQISIRMAEDGPIFRW
jgi:hypothetical protein